MKKMVLFLALAGVLAAHLAYAQTCQRDSNLLLTRQLLSPAPYYPDSPYYNLKEACINEPYNQSVTVFVPDTFVYLGFQVPIQSVSIALTNAIQNYPTGMVYSCDPPNCVFQALSLGCILMHGTPSPSNNPDTFDLGIAVRVKTVLGDVPLVLPRDINPAYHYYLILKQQGECSVATQTPENTFVGLRLTPNPTTGQTYLETASSRDGIFDLDIFDMFGRLQHTQKLGLYEGNNRLALDLSALSAGSYFIVVRDEHSRAVHRLVRL